eukprot:TRINITY_DN4376_c0_g1_i1.p1 TRINITY_DN4376_c0_g1~~TRINITY_DN4376_c0_g1_i1.p1  ORF type:complete len:531 (+),score=102.10 TRINITY_DN4376_c0_g1_i1:37-1629(+)
MRSFLILSFLFLFLSLSLLSHSYEYDDIDVPEIDGIDFRFHDQSSSKVAIITTENFEQILEDNENILIEFFAPWDEACQDFAPDYDLVATTLKDLLLIASVDVTTDPSLALEYRIRSYPTIILIKGQDLLTYEGELEANELISWTYNNIRPNVTTLNSAEEIEGFGQKSPFIIAAVTKDTPAQNLLHNLGHHARYLSVAEVLDTHLQELLSLKPNEFRLYPDDDDSHVLTESLEKFSTPRDIQRWIIFNSHQLLSPLDDATFQQLAASDVVFSIFFVPSDQMSTWMPSLTNLAEDLKNSVKILWATSEQAGSFAKQFGATGEVFPTQIAFQSDKSARPLAWNEEVSLTYDGALEWLKGVVEGTSIGFIKSQSIPESNSGPVTSVVAKNFVDIVLDPTKDVLLQVFADWCHHCHIFAPKYEELASLFKPVKTLVIASIDGDANALPENVIYDSYPSFFFFPAHSKTPIEFADFTGSLFSLAEFVKAHSSPTSEAKDVEIPESMKPIPTENDEDEEDLIDLARFRFGLKDEL